MACGTSSQFAKNVSPSEQHSPDIVEIAALDDLDDAKVTVAVFLVCYELALASNESKGAGTAVLTYSITSKTRLLDIFRPAADPLPPILPIDGLWHLRGRSSGNHFSRLLDYFKNPPNVYRLLGMAWLRRRQRPLLAHADSIRADHP
ncbi:hypothetical protein RhiJN_12874 [Ceratobasidium sp. AG-Ba]|nr:hypothetical protein RhiJN_12874 [Ceratobasidium sp. AG-Ba]